MTDCPTPAWMSWDDDSKAALKQRLVVACAKAGICLGDQPTPGALALQLDRKVVQRDYMAKIDQAFADVRSGEVDRVLIDTPPQVGKTSRVVWGIFWWLSWHPNDPVILASYGAALAATRGRMVRTLVEKHGAPYGLVKDPAQWARNDWSTSSGAAMRTGGMATGVTGNPAALLVIDDPHKDRAEADSQEMREKVWNTYSSSLLSRLRPRAPIILVQTRWHKDDLAGRVLDAEGREDEGGRWRVLHMPAIADAPNDLLGREIGHPLQHPWIPPGDVAEALRHWQEKKRTSTLRDWAALYQGNPVPAEGALLTEDQVKAARHRGELPPAKRVGVGIDPSGGGRDLAGIIAGVLGVDGRLYWTHDRSLVASSEEWSRQACLLGYEIGADFFVYEHNYGGDAMKLALRTAWEALQREGLIPADGAPCPRIIGAQSRRGKYLRAEPIAQQVIEDNARFHGLQLLDFEKDWLTFQTGASDSPGRLDAGVHLAYKLIRVPGSESVVSTVKDRPRTPAGTSRTAARRINR